MRNNKTSNQEMREYVSRNIDEFPDGTITYDGFTAAQWLETSDDYRFIIAETLNRIAMERANATS